MKTLFLACLCAISTLSLSADVKEDPLAHIDRDELSLALGHLIVRHLMNPGFDFNLEKMVQGIQDEQKGIASPMSEAEYEQAIYALQENFFLQAAEKNLSEANAFLDQNKESTTITAVEEKLQYKIAQEGKGIAVEEDSTPLIHYKGSLIDGTVFADSSDLGEPVLLPIQQSIPGFAKGLVGMKEGEKRILYIHPELAYGVSGNLPPNSLLIFEVEVLKANSVQEEVAQTAEEDLPIAS